MNIKDFMATYLLNKSTGILGDVTESQVKEALAGLDKELEGLSEDSITKMFVETRPFKSYVDKRVDHGLRTREENLRSEFAKEQKTLSQEIDNLKKTNMTLKASVPLPEDPAELRKRALDEIDPAKRDNMNMRADYLEMKNQLAERTALEEQREAELRREKLVNVARNEWGDTKLPQFMIEHLSAYTGPDEDTTKAKIKTYKEQWDSFIKDYQTSAIDTKTPPGSGEVEKTEQELVQANMDKMNNLGF